MMRWLVIPILGAALLGAGGLSLQSARGDGTAVEETCDVLRQAIKDEDATAADAAIQALAASTRHAVLELILDAMIAVPIVFDAGQDVLARHPEDTLAGAFEKSLHKKKDWSRAAALFEVFAAMTGPKSEALLIEGLGHKSRNVRRVAMRSLVTRRSKNAIPSLIAILEEEGIERGALAYDAERALNALTGRDFDTAEDWRNYWEGHKATLDPAQLEDDTGGATGVVVPGVDAPSFFGVSIISRNVAFVIDVSGSMIKYDEGGEEAGSQSSWTQRQRILRAKRELARAVRNLDRRAKFNMIAFSSEISSFQQKLVASTSGMRKRAYTWIMGLEAKGATHADEALRRAFEDESIDTIVFLSDGAPEKSTGEEAYALVPRIREEVRQMNRLRKLRIFTFGFEGQGKWPPGSPHSHRRSDTVLLRNFLVGLAEDNGGTYTAID